MFDFPPPSMIADEIVLLRRALLQLLNELDKAEVRTIDTTTLRLILKGQANETNSPQSGKPSGN